MEADCYVFFLEPFRVKVHPIEDAVKKNRNPIEGSIRELGLRFRLREDERDKGDKRDKTMEEKIVAGNGHGDYDTFTSAGLIQFTHSLSIPHKRIP